MILKGEYMLVATGDFIGQDRAITYVSKSFYHHQQLED